MMSTLSLLVAVTALVTGGIEARPQPEKSVQDSRARLQDVEDMRWSKGLHAAALAREGKRYVGFEMISVELLAADLETVADASDLVLRVTVGENRTRLARDGSGKETVVLDYALRVHEVFKGGAELTDSVIVWTVPGGVYQFHDGSRAEILTPGFRKPLPDEEYVVFLRKDPLYGHHELAFGEQALFRLHTNGSVEADADGYPTGHGVLKDSRAEFMQRVRDAMNVKRVGNIAVSLLALAGTLATLQAQNKPTVTQDPVTGDYVVEMRVGGAVRQLRYTPATKLQFRVRGKVAHVTGTRDYLYHYTFENDSKSQQDLYSIALAGPMPAQIWDSPAGWEPNQIASTGRVYWYRITRGLGREGISPGAKLGGFILRSEFLPGPVEVQGAGNVGPLQVAEGTPGEMIEALDGIMRQDYVVSPAIGPAVPTGLNEPELTPAAQLSRVRATFGAALRRPQEPAALRIEQALGRGAQAFETGSAAEGRRFLKEIRNDATRLTGTPWLSELADALRMNLDHIERRFGLAAAGR